jgi:hypothetical protein
MWDNLQTGDDLLPVQQYLLKEISDAWAVRPRIAVQSPRQNSINRTLIEFAIKKQAPTLILCSDEKRFQVWRSIIQGYSIDATEASVSELKLKKEETPFTMATYGQLCNSMNATLDEKYSARAILEYEMASVGAWDKESDNIGDFDAVKETEVLLNDEAIRQNARYNQNLLRFIEVPERIDLIESGWLNTHIDELLETLEDDGLELVICDDSYEVTGVWAEALNYILRKIDKLKVLSLSPLQVNFSALSPRNFQLQKSMFDSQPIIVKLPLMVRDGCFKAYRGLVALSRPTEDEVALLSQANENLRGHLASVEDESLVELTLSQFVFDELALMEKDIPGNWSKRRAYIEALLNFVAFYQLKTPLAWQIFVQKLVSVVFEKNLPVIRDYIFRVLFNSEKGTERRLGESLIIAFRPLGFELNELMIEKSTSLIPNILNRSKSKENALVHYLTQEFIALQRDLKALVLCDFIDNSSASEIFPGNEFDSSTCGMVSILQKLEGSPITLQMNPIVFYGDTIYFNRKYKVLLTKEVEKIAGNTDVPLDVVRAEESGYCYIAVSGPENFQHFWKPLFKTLLANKITHCLVLSREFLNEKWDGVNFNTYFNMSSASSELFGIRLLARILLKDDDPVDATHLWDFSTVMPEIELGISDYLRVAVRKSHGWHVSEDGEFEQGISYFHSSLKLETKEFPKELITMVNDTAERMIGSRAEISNMWLERVSESNACREVLEIHKPENDHTSRKIELTILAKKKPVQVKVNYGQIMESMCVAVLQTIVELEEVSEQPRLDFTSKTPGVYRVEVLGDDQDLAERVFIAIESLFVPIKNQPYVVSLSFEDKVRSGLLSRLFADSGPRHYIPFAVPACFTKKIELGKFLKYWQALVSSDKMLGHRLPEVKTQVQEMKANMPFEFYPKSRVCRLLV